MPRKYIRRKFLWILCLILLIIPFSETVYGQEFVVSYDDPADDVEDLEGHIYSQGHENIDIIMVSSEENLLKTQLILKLKVKGIITDSEDITYCFNLQDGDELIYMVYYCNGDCMGLNFKSESDPENPQATGVDTDTLEVRIQISSLGEVDDYDLYGQADENYNEGEQFLMDVAPDSAFDFDGGIDDLFELPVMIVEPKNGSTLSGPVNIEGGCDEFYGMESVELQFDSKGAWISASSNDNWETWNHNWQSTDLADGEHTLQVRAYDGIAYYFDSITIYVDQSNAVSPRTMNVPQLKSGSELRYSLNIALPDYEFMEDISMDQSAEMVMTVIKIENVNVNENDFEAYVIDVSMEMTMSMTLEGETVTTKSEGTGTQWTRVSDLATIKAVSETTSISFGESSGFESEIIYDPPLNGYDFPLSIAEKWTGSSEASIKDTFYFSGEPEVWEESFESTIECEALHVADVTVPAGTFETFAIWSSEGEGMFSDRSGIMFMGGGPGYTVNYLSHEIGFPVKTQQFYPNRELYMTMELESYSASPDDRISGSKATGGDLPFYYILVPVLIIVILALTLVVKKRKKGDEIESWDQYSTEESQPVVSQTPPTPYGAVKTKVPPYPPLPPPLQIHSPSPPKEPVSALPQTTCPRCKKSFYVQKGATTITCPYCGISGKLVG
jgi:hypothetical protein